MDPSTATRRDTALFSIAIIIVSLAASYTVANFTADDAYIVARYAANLAAGRGLVFNSGEHVSALTSPGEALLLAALAEIFGPGLIAYKFLCVVGTLATLCYVAQRAFARSDLARLFLVMTALSPFTLMWTVGGLETPLLLIIATFLAHLSLDVKGEATVGWIWILASLAFVIRYDSVLFTGPIVLFSVWRAHRASLLTVRSARFLPALIIPIAWLAFASSYYGDIFPTSFYVKQLPFTLRDIENNLVYEANFVVISGLLAVAWIIVKRPRTVGGNLRSQVSRRSRSFGTGLGLLAIALYGMSAATIHMMFGYRLLIPYLPAAVLWLLQYWNEGDARTRALRAILPFMLVWQMGVFVVALEWTVNPTLSGPRGVYEYPHLSLRAYSAFLSILDDNARDIQTHWASRVRHEPRPPRIVTYAAGRVPYVLLDAYFFEGLVSYRKQCHANWKPYADYVMIIYPYHKSRAAQLGKLLEAGQRISDRVVDFDGKAQHFEVWFNSEPLQGGPPSLLDGPCIRSPDDDAATDFPTTQQTDSFDSG